MSSRQIYRILTRNGELRPPNLRRILAVLKVIGKFASAFLLLWLFASPAMACLLPGAQLSQEEKECCRSMVGMCDDMARNTSHSCCVKVQTHNPSYVIAKTGSTFVQQLPATPLNFATFNCAISSATTPRLVPAEYAYPPGSSPPELYTLHVSFLI